MQKADLSKIKKALPLEDSGHLLDLHGPVFLLDLLDQEPLFFRVLLLVLMMFKSSLGYYPRLMHLLAKLEKSKSDHCKSITACIRDVCTHL